MRLNQLRYYISMLRAAPFMKELKRQANHIMDTMPDLPAPENIIKDGGENAFHILALGESSIASIGVDDQEDGLTGHLAQIIEQRKNRACAYEIAAKSGYSAGQVVSELIPTIKTKRTDLIVVGLGANDSFQVSSPSKWNQKLNELLEKVSKRFGKIPVIFINMPPILEFPIFTPLLKNHLHRQISLLKSELEIVLKQHNNTYMMQHELTANGFIEKYQLKGKSIDDFYSDGVHPSKLTYRYWAEEIYEFLVENQIL